MADIPDGTGIFGYLGTGLAALSAGFLLLRKYLSNDSVERASNEAQLQIIQMLQEQVKNERARADAAVQARDQAVEQIGQLKAQVAELTLQVQSLHQEVARNVTPQSKT